MWNARSRDGIKIGREASGVATDCSMSGHGRMMMARHLKYYLDIYKWVSFEQKHCFLSLFCSRVRTYAHRSSSLCKCVAYGFFSSSWQISHCRFSFENCPCTQGKWGKNILAGKKFERKIYSSTQHFAILRNQSWRIDDSDIHKCRRLTEIEKSDWTCSSTNPD